MLRTAFTRIRTHRKPLVNPCVTRILTAVMLLLGIGFTYSSYDLSNDNLIHSLKENGVLKSKRVENVMRSVDRKNYCKEKMLAYIDSPQTIGQGQTISAPHMHCIALEELSPVINDGAHVLDVGSGSGYLTACFGRMVGKSGKVVGLERMSNLVSWAKQNIEKDHPQLLEDGIVEIVEGDGWQGYLKHAPYDAIHVGAAAESLPEKLVQQLKPGGILIIPVGRASSEQVLVKVKKDNNGKVSQEKLMGVIYVPLVKQQN